jgi:RimJ/RimL family protein N-acetyltransferase
MASPGSTPVPAPVPVSPAPVVHTDRLTLRAHRAGDLDDCVAMWGDPGVTRYIGGRTFSREEVWTRLLRHVGHWCLMGFGYWVVEETASRRFVGEVGFAELKRDLKPSLEGSAEIGWVLAPWCHGQGYATEAARAALSWIASNLPSARTTCIISPGNLPSLRVAEKCGYREFGRTIYKGDAVILFER